MSSTRSTINKQVLVELFSSSLTSPSFASFKGTRRRGGGSHEHMGACCVCCTGASSFESTPRVASKDSASGQKLFIGANTTVRSRMRRTTTTRDLIRTLGVPGNPLRDELAPLPCGGRIDTYMLSSDHLRVPLTADRIERTPEEYTDISKAPGTHQ